ncbi:MAG: GNAT family N-acetyltransferase [Oligoflexia bacterium]|nr:GNAT family N-acetyltransferase [Oligoflexia bacterium]
MTTIEVREVTEGRGAICDELFRALPKWFGIEGAIREYVSDVERMPTLVAYAGERAVGLVALNRHSEWTSEIHVMAVHPEFHRLGIGKRLVREAEAYLRRERTEFLSVKTLSPSRPNREYELTRRFYFAMGFRTVEEFKTLWGEANPCLLLIKSLRE